MRDLFDTSLVQFKPRLLWRITDISRVLDVRPQNVDMWHKRRSGGFPAPVAFSIVVTGGGRRRAPLWDSHEVMRWFLEYDPNARRGGKPGNRGGRKQSKVA